MFATICAACEGRGSHGYTQLHAYGSTLEPEHMDEPCTACDGQGYEPTQRPVCLACGLSVEPGAHLVIWRDILLHAACEEDLFTCYPRLKEL